MRLAVLIVVWLTGCEAIFELDSPPDAPFAGSTQPVQQIQASRKEGDAAPFITLTPTPTGDGNTLLVIALVRSMSAHISAIVGGPTPWSAALVGNNYQDDTRSPVRVEVWYSPLAQSTQSVVVMAPDKPIAVLFVELELPSAAITLGAGKADGDVMSDTASTSDITIAGRTLVVSAVAFNVVSSATLDTPGYTELIPISADDVHAASALQLIDDTTTANAQWTLGNPGAHWNTAIVGLEL